GGGAFGLGAGRPPEEGGGGEKSRRKEHDRKLAFGGGTYSHASIPSRAHRFPSLLRPRPRLTLIDRASTLAATWESCVIIAEEGMGMTALRGAYGLLVVATIG